MTAANSDLIKTREVVVVTGASAGLGRAIVREFARHGATIGLLSRDRARLEAALDEVHQRGSKGIAIVGDVSNADDVERAADEIESKLGPIDIWINNAMVTVFGPFDKVTPDEYRRVTEVVYLGQVWGTRAALNRMKPRGRGHIVQVGSALAYRSIPLQSAYCGAKHAIKGFTESVRCELIHDRSNVRITMVQMPAMNTPQFDWCRSHMDHHPQPVPPIYNPEVGARAVYWAAHHNRRELQVGASTLGVVLGQKIVPGWLDLYLGRTGYASQQTRERTGPRRADNLFATMKGDFGAHGSFDRRATRRSIELWFGTHRGASLAVALLATGFAFTGMRRLLSK